MNIYDYFLKKNGSFIPKTPSAAIAGIKKGLLPKESFLSLSLFLYSPFGTPGKLKALTEHEELQRLNELERIISKKNLNLETEMLLIYTLDKLVEHKNPEIALFAAESINSIENRYNKRIYELKENISSIIRMSDIVEIIKLLFNYGYINRGKSDIQHFYYNEALNYYKLLTSQDNTDLKLQILKIKMLNQLNRFQDSRDLVNELKYNFIPEWHKVLLLMEIEFEARNFYIISDLVKDLDIDLVPIEFKERIEQWMV